MADYADPVVFGDYEKCGLCGKPVDPRTFDGWSTGIAWAEWIETYTGFTKSWRVPVHRGNCERRFREDLGKKPHVRPFQGSSHDRYEAMAQALARFGSRLKECR